MIVTGVVLHFPPCIRHVGDRPEQEKQSLVVNQALLNLRVPHAACKLMRFYASRSNGFRPSLSFIQAETGINKYNISRCRATLVRYGLLGYDENAVIVDWVRLRAFAFAEAKRMGQKQHWKINPVNPDLLGRTKNDLHTYWGTNDAQSRRLYNLYVATEEAIRDGVEFPELRGKDVTKLLGHTKNDLHTYRDDKSAHFMSEPQKPECDSEREEESNLLGQPNFDLHTYGDEEYLNLLGRTKSDLHNYGSDKHSDLLGHTKSDLHTYWDDEQASHHEAAPHEESSWYSPFGEEDPPWVYQRPVVDAYGEIVGYMHYDTELPF